MLNYKLQITNYKLNISLKPCDGFDMRCHGEHVDEMQFCEVKGVSESGQITGQIGRLAGYVKEMLYFGLFEIVAQFVGKPFARRIADGGIALNGVLWQSGGEIVPF